MTISRINIYMVFVLLVLSYSVLYSQENYERNSQIEGKIIDTIKVNENSCEVLYSWLNDTVEVKIYNQEITIDEESLNGLSAKQIKKANDLLMSWRQNCFSYALEKYLASNNFNNQQLFNKRTTIGLKTIHQIIERHFTEVMTIHTSPKKNLRKRISDNLILAFFSESDLIIHAVYYSKGTFYSKNGGHKPTEFKNLRKFLKKHYGNTKYIKAYKIN